MPIRYDGKRLIPAPVFSVSRSFDSLADGTVIGKTYQIQVNGTLLPYMGSPNSSGNFETSLLGYPPNEIVASENRLEASLNKQRALRDLFGADNLGKKFEIIPLDGEPITYFYPKSIALDLPEGILHDSLTYSITMTSDAIYPDTDGTFINHIENASETWSIEPDQQDINNVFNFRVTHSLNAKGKKYYNSSGVATEAWVEAKNFVRSKLGLNSSGSYLVLNSGLYSTIRSMSGYNHSVSENVDLFDGAYSVTESWIYASGYVYEDLTVNVSKDIEGITSVSVDGNITGYEDRYFDEIKTTKWQNASGYYKSILNDILNRAQKYSEISLNPIPVSVTEGRNPVAGTINYNYEYNNRPRLLISGAKTESITVSYTNKSLKHAEIPVIGRPIGPVLQDLGTSDASRKSLSIDFTLGPPESGVYTLSNIKNAFQFPYHLISDIVTQLDPLNNGAISSFYGQPQWNWEPSRGAGSFSVEWTYE